MTKFAASYLRPLASLRKFHGIPLPTLAGLPGAAAVLLATLWLGPQAWAQCTNLCLQQPTCPGSETTSITGTVYAPNGVDPLPNVLVYVPNSAVQAFTPGVACEL